MAKTELTIQLEKDIYKATMKQGVFGCFEVTIGWFGKERVDYLTYDTKGIWRCYEIKVSLKDFYSSASKTFVGHYNYFVMTKDLYEKVRDVVPDDIGVYVGSFLIKRAKKRPLGVEDAILKESLIRSLSREQQKLAKMESPEYLNGLNRKIKQLEQDKQEERRQVFHYRHVIREMCETYELDYKEVRKRFLSTSVD